jgi:ferredoxin-type protein NapH
MNRNQESLSVADIPGPGLYSIVRYMIAAGVLFFFFSIIGEPYFFSTTSLVLGIAFIGSGIVVQLFTTDSIAESARWFTHSVPGRILQAGVFFVLVAMSGAGLKAPVILFGLGIGLVALGSWRVIVLRHSCGLPGVRNTGIQTNPVISRGAVGWLLGLVFTGFYVLVYWFPDTLEGIVRTTDSLSFLMRGRASDQWFMYGLFYSMAVGIMGIRAYYRYRHDRYQVMKIISIVFFQLIIAFVLPSILVLFNQPEFYFSYFWPLKWQYLWPGDYGFGWILRDGGRLGVFMVFWGAALTLIATPILTYFLGKRWYCSWVCGCGGLAETLGDPFRHQSDCSEKSWRIERWLIYSVLVVIILVTILIWVNSALEGAVLGQISNTVARVYGFLVGSVWAGVIGVGFYPLMGNRVWCRYGCPMAALLGLQQKYFSRFRITTNGGQCISCGNCSVYCEMGIDVRAYAQRGQDIVRASCVGCGICSVVCPRGVLKLENGPVSTRTLEPKLVHFESDDVLAR